MPIENETLISVEPIVDVASYLDKESSCWQENSGREQDMGRRRNQRNRKRDGSTQRNGHKEYSGLGIASPEDQDQDQCEAVTERSRHRSSTVLRVGVGGGDAATTTSPLATSRSRLSESGDDASTEEGGAKLGGGTPTDEDEGTEVRERPSTIRTGDSDSSSGSGSTVVMSSTGSASPPAHKIPDALSFLDPDSQAAVTDETIQRTVADARESWQGKTSPSARSTSSTASTVPSNASGASSSSPNNREGGSENGGHDTDRSSSPEHAAGGDGTGTGTGWVTKIVTIPSSRHSRRRGGAKGHLQTSPEDRYGTPEMPRGTAKLPHLPPKSLNPRPPPSAKHLPRAEKLPLSGYELLAARLSGQDRNLDPNNLHVNSRAHRGSFGSNASSHSSGSQQQQENGGGGQHYHQHQHHGESTPSTPAQPPIKPIYRRFEALNHRLLLHLQDELSELEEQLHRLDTADTQTRRVQSHILPASRRAEALAGGELQWHKTDILGKIGFKLSQYNHVLASFTETQKLPAPSLRDVDTYRTYLATQSPIAEIETRFLEPTNDLVSLARRPHNRHRRRSDSADSSSSDRSSALSFVEEDEEAYYAGGENGDGDGEDFDDALTPMPDRGAFAPHDQQQQQQHQQEQPSSSPRSMRSFSSSSSDPSSAETVPPPANSLLLEQRSLAAKRRQHHGHGTHHHHRQQRGSGNNSSSISVGGFAATLFAIAAAVLVPALTFAVIPDFVGRMTVVFLVVMAVVGAQMQTELLQDRGGRKGGAAAAAAAAAKAAGGGGGTKGGGNNLGWLLGVGAYGAVMAGIAGVF